MYKILLCWRYLRTRYIALASIISVMLGVATMIVVNSVMAGFNREMQERIHEVLSDIVFESRNLDGFENPEWHMEQIRQIAGDEIAAMTPTVIVPAMINFQVGGQASTGQVTMIGVDAKSHAAVSDFGRFLQHPVNRKQLSFDLQQDGYEVRDYQSGSDKVVRPQMEAAGWKHRKMWVARQQAFSDAMSPASADAPPDADESEEQPVQDDQQAESTSDSSDPFQKFMPKEKEFDPANDQHIGVILGIALANYRTSEGKEGFLMLPGDDVRLSAPTIGLQPKLASRTFTIVDFYESKMSEYDSGFVFVPIETLQEMRGMIDPSTKMGRVTAIQIKLQPGANGDEVCHKLRRAFEPRLYGVQTWRDKQGPLLAAVKMETAILNVLLFLIIAVAGFGILAIFFMIVVEKTRDIGILKSLGASGSGILGIFLTYGLSLGLVGSGVGMVIGLLFVTYINEIAKFLGMITGREVFDPAIYYFQKIPTLVDPFTITWIVIGAMLIAVVASILPARRAARLHPVEALRYE